MIFADFFKALAQLNDARFRRALWLGVALALALLAGFYAGLLWFLENVIGETVIIPWIGEITWLGDLLGVGSILLMLVLSAILMVPVASAMTSLFLDDVAQAVEARHYPSLAPAARISWWDTMRDTINYVGLIIAANILAVFAYFALPPATPFIFYAMNGLLLGREYFQIAAMRREGRQRARELRSQHRWKIWRAGCLMALPLSIPVVNLLIPILAAATFTHLYHRLR